MLFILFTIPLVEEQLYHKPSLFKPVEQEHIKHDQVPHTDSANKANNMLAVPLLLELVPARPSVVEPDTVLDEHAQAIGDAPPEPLPLQVVPQPDVHKDEPRGQPLVLAPAERDVHVADGPLVEARVPELPEEARAQHHGDAVGHVLVGVDAVKNTEEAEEAPDDQELHPHPVHDVEQHGEELERAHPGGPHVGLVDGVCVDVVVDHVEGNDVETYLGKLEKSGLDGKSLLRSKVLSNKRVERQNWTRYVEDGMENIDEIVDEAVIVNGSVLFLKPFQLRVRLSKIKKTKIKKNTHKKHHKHKNIR